MSEYSFLAIRDDLEARIDPPPFDALISRRRGRTRSQALFGVATAAILIAAAVMVGNTGPGDRSSSAPAAGPNRPAAARTHPVAGPRYLGNLTFGADGALYALSGPCTEQKPQPCSPDDTEYDMSVVRSTDLGTTWTALGLVSVAMDVSVGLHLIVGDRQHMWVAMDGYGVFGTSDGWKTSFADPLGGLRPASQPGPITGDGHAAWIAYDGTVRETDGRGYSGSTLPGGIVRVVALAASYRSPGEQAWAVGLDAGTKAHWFTWTSAGGTWRPIPSPCVGDQYTDAPSLAVVNGTDTLWAICANRAADRTRQPKYLVRSTDGGATWTTRQDLPDAGSAQAVYPFSATVAWRTGAYTPIYHTTDGRAWSAAGDQVAEPGGPIFFTALNARVAVYQADDLMITTDGGITWRPVRH